jgi:nucleotide-binding universal stress UspA family protein
MIDANRIPRTEAVHQLVRQVRPANSTELELGSSPTPGSPAPGASTASRIHHATWGSRTAIRARRILVGMDFSAAAESARRLALGIALGSDALVDLVHVFDGFTEAFTRHDPRVFENLDGLLGEIEHALARRERMGRVQGVRCVHTSLVGAPGIELAAHAARTRADLIVLADGEEEPGRFGFTWGRRASRQILQSTRWNGLILLRAAPM